MWNLTTVTIRFHLQIVFSRLLWFRVCVSVWANSKYGGGGLNKMKPTWSGIANYWLCVYGTSCDVVAWSVNCSCTLAIKRDLMKYKLCFGWTLETNSVLKPHDRHAPLVVSGQYKFSILPYETLPIHKIDLTVLLLGLWCRARRQRLSPIMYSIIDPVRYFTPCKVLHTVYSLYV